MTPSTGPLPSDYSVSLEKFSFDTEWCHPNNQKLGINIRPKEEKIEKITQTAQEILSSSTNSFHTSCPTAQEIRDIESLVPKHSKTLTKKKPSLLTFTCGEKNVDCCSFIYQLFCMLFKEKGKFKK